VIGGAAAGAAVGALLNLVVGVPTGHSSPSGRRRLRPVADEPTPPSH
jgi:hypothetical protein